jgi:predicted XRE-type DNA-binding protein
MSKLTQTEEKELISFIKDWLKSHGFNQKDLANELNIKSGRTSEIILKIKDLYKKGGMFNIAKNLIKIEQKWLENIKNDYRETKQPTPYNQLDLDSLVTKMNQDISE